MLTPVIVDESEYLKHGDVFTIFADKTAKNWQMVEGKTFIAVPQNYEGNRSSKYWRNKIDQEEAKLANPDT